MGGHARPMWEAVGVLGGRPQWEAEVGGRSGRPKWEAEVGGRGEAEVGGRSGRPCEADLGGRARPWEAVSGRPWEAEFGLSDWLRQIT